jgi:hypothetical protein
VSFDAIRWALAQDAGKSSTKFVLVAMAEHVNAESQEWVCWPSYRALSEVTLQDIKTVEAAVYRLKELGFIVDTGERKGGTGKVIVYRLNNPENGGVTPGLQPGSANGTRPQNTTENGVITGNGNPPKFPPNPPKFPPNPPKFPEISPQISGETTPKTGDGSSKGSRKGSRKEPAVGVRISAIEGVPDSLLADWLAVRKDKKAGTLTETAVKGLLREAAKAGITPEEAVRFCCEANWVGFNAGWYTDRVGAGQPAGRQETFV